ncbi:MAG: NAD-dependent epimerase/dehydratase family protein [Bryobacteraceae bacterium]
MTERLRGQTILITGATGFIGSHLAKRLVDAGAHVRCLVRSGKALPEGMVAVPGDLRNPVQLDPSDIVFHLAGVTKGSDAQAYFHGNVETTKNLLAALRTRRLVHVSSLAVMGPSRDGNPLDENALTRPVSDYGRSKLDAERAVRTSEFASAAVIVRPPVVYGPGDRDVFEVFRAASKGFFFRIGRVERYFSYVFVDDLVDGLISAATIDSAAGKTFFLASPSPVSWTEFADRIESLMNRKCKVVSLPESVAFAAAEVAEKLSRLGLAPKVLTRDKVREARHRYWICGTAHAESVLGFRAKTSLDEGLATTLTWYKNSKWLKS